MLDALHVGPVAIVVGSSTTMKPAQRWIGMFLAEVTDACHDFGKAKHAGVNAVALAASEQEFVARVWAALEGIGLRCTEYEDVEPYEARFAAYELSKNIEDAAERALTSGEVAFGTFHVTEDDSDPCE